jgi:acyl dehydratase
MPDDALTTRLEGRLATAAVDAAALERYRRVCGFEDAATLPLTYPHVLAAGLQMHLLARPDFPVRLAGLVHVRHVIIQHRPLAVTARPALRCWLEGSRRTDAGEEFCLHASAGAGGEIWWEEETWFIARTSQRGRRTPQRPPDPGYGTAERWVVPADAGRRYARVSGDYNPIHLWPVTARLFGFPGAIAHGMWSLARCAAALAPRTDGPCRVEARFLRPVVLPTTLEFQRNEKGAGPAFRLASPDGGVVYLSGALSDP